MDSWSDLPGWLNGILEAARKLTAERKTDAGRAGLKQVPPATTLSEERRRSYIAISQYLVDLESANLVEKVLSAALLEKISTKAEFTLDWLAGEIADFTEVGLGLAKALASATVRYMIELKLVEALTEASFRTACDAVRTLQSRSAAEWKKDRDRFYSSIVERLGPAAGADLTKFNEIMDIILQTLCVNFGQGMAEWVHRGIGRELGWQRTKELVKNYFREKEDARKAEAVFEALFNQPYEAEIPYLYRLLGSAFLANSVRLDPFASAVVRTTLSSYELDLDSNILLPVLIKEHEDHTTMKSIIEESRNAGVKVLVLRCFLDEMLGHLDVATRTVHECKGDLLALSEISAIWGKHANCFIQGYLNSLNASELEEGGNVSSASIKWEEYRERYTAARLDEYLGQLGLSVVPHLPYENPADKAEYQRVLYLITEEWSRRHYGSSRAPILNENEAHQFCHIYRRRRELKASNLAPEVWFLSFETVLARVFQRHASRWGSPPTFPFSAWVAFLDSRLPWAPRNPAAIVNAILKGNSEAFNLPDPVTLVRRKAFGDRIPTKTEEDALQLEMSSFALVQRVERARASVLSRGDLSFATEDSRKARKAATGEISKDLQETIRRLQEQVARQQKMLETKSEAAKPPIPSVETQERDLKKTLSHPKRKKINRSNLRKKRR